MSANESSTQSNRIYAVVFWVLAATAIAWGIFGILQSSDQAEKAFPLIADESLEIHLAQRPLSFEEILKGSNEASFFQRFENSAKAITGNDQVHVWIRIPIENTNRHPETWIIEVKQHLTSLCRMFIPNSGGTYEVYQSIPSIDPSIRQTPYPVPAFQVNLAAGEQKILYLKLQDANWISPQIRFWDSPIEFQKSLESDARFVNRYIGLLIGLFIANLAAFIAFRYKDVGYYLLYLVPAFIVNVLNFNVYGIEHWKLSGINQTSFTPDINHFLFYGFLILTAALHLLFVTEFLGRQQLSRRSNRILDSILIGLFALSPLVMFGPGSLFGEFMRVPAALIWCGSVLAILGLGAHAMRKGIGQARYLVAANFLLAIAAVRYAWAVLSGQNIAQEILHFWLYAACVEMTMLSYAMIERFMQLNEEKKRAQANLLNAAQEHGELQRRFNEKLSLTVTERTKELETTNQQKERLIEFLAHDIRTPLNALVSVSALLARSPGEFSKKKLEAFAQEIEGNARGVSELMENLLSWANLQNQRTVLQIQEYWVGDLIQEALSPIQTQAKLKSIQIKTNYPKDCFVFCDFHAIASVLRNLLSNALKFVPDGGHIELEVTEFNGLATFHLRDEGTGLSQQQIEQINAQHPLESTRGLQGEYGVGLGLGICFELLKYHQSQLQVHSVKGEHTQFFFNLTTEDSMVSRA